MDDENKFFIALDVPSAEDALKLVQKLPFEHSYYKVGMELYYKEGPSILEKLDDLGKKVFLDLKLYDIPTTVSKALLSLLQYPFFMVNLHVLGGKQMSVLAREAIQKDRNSYDRKIVGVTVLTSYDEVSLAEILPEDMQINPSIWAKHLAEQAKKWGLHGVVCSAQEALDIKKSCGEDFITVTPGLRFPEENSHDQKRVLSPRDARNQGCDFPVIGRSITGHNDHNKIKEMYDLYAEALRLP